jgi:hypothetical protein
MFVPVRGIEPGTGGPRLWASVGGSYQFDSDGCGSPGGNWFSVFTGSTGVTATGVGARVEQVLSSITISVSVVVLAVLAVLAVDGEDGLEPFRGTSECGGIKPGRDGGPPRGGR